MRALLSTLVVISYVPALALAQSPAAPQPSSEPTQATVLDSASTRAASFGSLFIELGHALAALPSRSNAITLGIGGALALTAHPTDRALIVRVAPSEPLDDVFEIGDAAGSAWVQAGGAIGVYLFGRLGGRMGVQEVGADLVRAQVVNAILTEGLKVAVRRTRPDGGRFSFPSGHASATFATATVLSAHLGWKVGVPAYGLAAYVAASRVQEAQHYASDVIFGAAIGIVAGRHATVGRGVARFEMSPIAVPRGAGISFTRLR